MCIAYICVCACIHMYVCIYECVYICRCVCIYVYIYVCACVCINVCVYGFFKYFAYLVMENLLEAKVLSYVVLLSVPLVTYSKSKSQKY